MTLDGLARAVYEATGAPLSPDEAEAIARAVLLVLAGDIERATRPVSDEEYPVSYRHKRRLLALVAEARSAEAGP